MVAIALKCLNFGLDIAGMESWGHLIQRRGSALGHSGLTLASLYCTDYSIFSEELVLTGNTGDVPK